MNVEIHEPNPAAAAIASSAHIDLFAYREAEAAGGIVYFDGTQHDFLSNFYPAPIYYAGNSWRTSEHAYQAMKFTDPALQTHVWSAKGPGEAKRLGRALPGIRPDWDTVKFQIMLEVVQAKFTQNEFLGAQLDATYPRPLIEGNHWHDRVWGFCLCPEHRFESGLNALGKTLELVREYRR